MDLDLEAYIADPKERKLLEALIEQMETKPIDKVSTSALLKRAGVSRAAFYRRYRDKYDLLNRNYQRLLDRTLCSVVEGTSYRDSFFRLYGVLRSAPVFFKNALSSHDQNSLRGYIYDQSWQVFEKMMESHGLSLDEPYYRLLLTGFLTGTLELTCLWAQNGMKEPLDMLFRLTYQLMPDELRTCVSLYYM